MQCAKIERILAGRKQPSVDGQSVEERNQTQWKGRRAPDDKAQALPADSVKNALGRPGLSHTIPSGRILLLRRLLCFVIAERSARRDPVRDKARRQLLAGWLSPAYDRLVGRI